MSKKVFIVFFATIAILVAFLGILLIFNQNHNKTNLGETTNEKRIYLLRPDKKIQDLPVYVYYGTITKLGNNQVYAKGQNDTSMLIALNDKTNYLKRFENKNLQGSAKEIFGTISRKIQYNDLRVGDKIVAFPVSKQDLRNKNKFLCQMIIVNNSNNE